jgi:hypothetical protein
MAVKVEIIEHAELGAKVDEVKSFPNHTKAFQFIRKFNVRYAQKPGEVWWLSARLLEKGKGQR